MYSTVHLRAVGDSHSIENLLYCSYFISYTYGTVIVSCAPPVDESEKLRALELEERKARGRAGRERKRHSSEDKSEATRKPSAASATGKENDEQKKSGRQVCSPQTALLQFGRRSSHCFTLDFSHPIAPIQAFAIALSSMHTKLGVD